MVGHPWDTKKMWNLLASFCELHWVAFFNFFRYFLNEEKNTPKMIPTKDFSNIGIPTRTYNSLSLNNKKCKYQKYSHVWKYPFYIDLHQKPMTRLSTSVGGLHSKALSNWLQILFRFSFFEKFLKKRISEVMRNGCPSLRTN